MTDRIKVEVGIAAALLAVLVFSFALKLHDESVIQNAVAEFRTQQLHADNVKLSVEVKRLAALLSDSEKRTAQRVTEDEKQRQAATTPQEQVLYVTTDSPNLHLRLPEPGEAPVISFPIAESSVLADIVRDKRVAVDNLAGCREQKGILVSQLETLNKTIANKDEEIALERGKKNGSKLSKLGYLLKGVAVGIGIAKFIL